MLHRDQLVATQELHRAADAADVDGVCGERGSAVRLGPMADRDERKLASVSDMTGPGQVWDGYAAAAGRAAENGGSVYGKMAPRPATSSCGRGRSGER